jgi:hypothetical protein
VSVTDLLSRRLWRHARRATSGLEARNAQALTRLLRGSRRIASAFRDMPRANTNLPTIAAAERLSDLIPGGPGPCRLPASASPSRTWRAA